MTETNWLTIGGSDIATIVGKNPWATKMDLYCRIKELVRPEPATEVMEWGNKLEHVVAEEYEIRTPYVIEPIERFEPIPAIYNADTPYFRYSPDRLVYADIECVKTLVGGLECKTTSAWNKNVWGDAETDEVPPVYYLQCCWYLSHYKFDWWDLAVLIGGNEFRIYRINRDLDIENWLIAEAHKFWREHILADMPPELDHTDSTKKYLDSLPKTVNDLKVAGISDEDWAFNLEKISQKKEKLEKEQNIAQAHLKASIGGADGLASPNFDLTWKENKNGTRVFRFKYNEN